MFLLLITHTDMKSLKCYLPVCPGEFNRESNLNLIIAVMCRNAESVGGSNVCLRRLRGVS